MKYRFEPGAEIATVADGGEELRLVFDKQGVCEVPDDFQEATRVLDAHPQVKREKKADS